MTTTNQNRDLFTDQGCLTTFAVKGMIRGDLSAEQVSETNKHIDTCILCKEALEGARKFNDLGDYDSGISELQKTWKSKKEQSNHSFGERNIKFLPVAASIALLIGFSIFWFVNKKSSDSYIADITKQGIALDSAITNLPIHTINRHQNFIAMDETDSKSRTNYLSDRLEKRSVIPLGKIENTRVFARSYTSDKSEYELYSQINKTTHSSHLNYPNVIMHKPPPHLDMKMPDEVIVGDDVFVVVEEMPQFRGSDLQSFREYVQQKIKYPGEAIEQHIYGRVYAQFTINRMGELVDAEILLSVHPALDREVLRVLKSSPIWQPGKQRDKAVSVSMIMPIDFYLY